MKNNEGEIYINPYYGGIEEKNRNSLFTEPSDLNIGYVSGYKDFLHPPHI